MKEDVPQSPGAYRLQKNGNVIYVGSAINLRSRYYDWINNPDNPCVKRNGFDLFVWQQTATHSEAKALELQYYNQYNPVCNLVSPPGR